MPKRHQQVDDMISELRLLTPEEFQEVVIDPSRNVSRGFASEKQWDRSVDDLIEQITDAGRIREPLHVHQTSDGLVLDAGFRRAAAATKLHEMGEPLMVPVLVVPEVQDGLSSALENLAENFQRLDPTPMDAAMAIQRLSAKPYEMTDKAIAKAMGKGESTIRTLRKLLAAPKTLQTKLNNGEYTLESALEILNTPPDAREAVSEEAAKHKATDKKTGAQKVTEEAVQKAKEKVLNKPINKIRSPKVIMDSFIALSNDAEGYGQNLADLANIIVKFVAGKLTEAKMFEKLQECEAVIGLAAVDEYKKENRKKRAQGA